MISSVIRLRMIYSFFDFDLYLRAHNMLPDRWHRGNNIYIYTQISFTNEFVRLGPSFDGSGKQRVSKTIRSCGERVDHVGVNAMVVPVPVTLKLAVKVLYEI